MVLGAVQVPPDGRPVVFLADHPTTGGYPVIAVVRSTDLAAAAQAASGTPVRFVAVRRR
jgi:allophanate hydrolase subunit 2